MYRRNQSKTLYRAVARRVWERYRPSLLDMPVGLRLLRDPDVSLRSKLYALTVSLAVAVGLFGLQWLLARTIGLHRPVIAPMVEPVLALAVLAIAAPLAMVRIVEPAHVVRLRLRKTRVIPLRRQ